MTLHWMKTVGNVKFSQISWLPVETHLGLLFPIEGQLHFLRMSNILTVFLDFHCFPFFLSHFFMEGGRCGNGRGGLCTEVWARFNFFKIGAHETTWCTFTPDKIQQNPLCTSAFGQRLRKSLGFHTPKNISHHHSVHINSMDKKGLSKESKGNPKKEKLGRWGQI